MKKGLRCDFRQPANSTPIANPARVDLELLHNWTISTSSTLSANPQVRDLWRIIVPQIGFSTQYILNGILALSALHMARYNPTRRDRLLSLATGYHTASLEEALPLMPSISAQSCGNLFLFAVLTTCFTFANTKEVHDMPIVGNGTLPEWLYLLRGINTVVETDESAMVSSPASLVYSTTNLSHEFWITHTPVEHDALAELQAKILRNTIAGSSKQNILLKTINILKRSYTFLGNSSFQEDEKSRAFYSWLLKISDEYIQLLKDADSQALCILAFFSVLMRDLEKKWWLEGWAIRLIRRVYHLLDEAHRLWIVWPIEQLGWVPERTTGSLCTTNH